MNTSAELKGDEAVSTFGGEYCHLDGSEFADYGISFGEHTVHGLTPTQAVALACILVDHLIINGHRFEIQDTGEQDQRRRLVAK